MKSSKTVRMQAPEILKMARTKQKMEEKKVGMKYSGAHNLCCKVFTEICVDQIDLHSNPIIIQQEYCIEPWDGSFYNEKNPFVLGIVNSQSLHFGF